MAKRFTDTDKWKDEWYLSLPNDYKIVWQYMLDNCTHAGILKKGFDLMSFCCKTKVIEDKFNDVFNGRIIDFGSFYFIPKFIKFQYGIDLDSKRPVVVSVLKELNEKGILERVRESLLNDCISIVPIIKSMSTSKSKDTTKDKSIIEEPKTLFLTCVYLTKEEHDKLMARFGEEGTAQRIFDLNNGIMSKGYKYKSHYHTILSWERRNDRTK